MPLLIRVERYGAMPFGLARRPTGRLESVVTLRCSGSILEGVLVSPAGWAAPSGARVPNSVCDTRLDPESTEPVLACGGGRFCHRQAGPHFMCASPK
jgi:hypothetical protein